MADFKTQAIAEINKFLDAVDRKIEHLPPQAQETIKKTGQRPAHVAVAAGLLSFLIVLFGFGPSALVHLIGFVYPCYASFKALKTDGTDDDTQWLTYWVVFGFFDLCEAMFGMFFKSFFYYVLKAAFLVWCFLPQTEGANLVYNKVVLPIMNRYESRIDGASGKVAAAAKQVQDEAGADVMSAAAAGITMGKKKLVASAVDSLIAEAAAEGKKQA